jgi:hypothetical protein
MGCPPVGDRRGPGGRLGVQGAGHVVLSVFGSDNSGRRHRRAGLCRPNPTFTLEGLQGKVALLECPINTRQWSEQYKVWGLHPTDEKFPTATRPARGPVGDLTPFQKAGAVGVILAWTDISDANAADQYTPFSRPLQNIPGLYVGRDTGARLHSLAGTGAKATVVLEAEVFPDTPTETLIATLPGTSADEIIIVNTHTDGPNATEENGAIGILALMKYFSKIPESERKRTIVCPLTTGHFAGPWVPSIRGVISKYPDIVKKAVAAVTVEHLGCGNGWTMRRGITGTRDARNGAWQLPLRSPWPIF